MDLVWDGSGSRTPAVPWCGRHPRGGGSELAPTGDASDRAAVLFCWASRAAHPAAEVEAEAELEIVRSSGEIGRRSGLGRHRGGEGETAVRAVPEGRIGLRPGCIGLQGCRPRIMCRVAASEGSGEGGEGVYIE